MENSNPETIVDVMETVANMEFRIRRNLNSAISESGWANHHFANCLAMLRDSDSNFGRDDIEAIRSALRHSIQSAKKDIDAANRKFERADEYLSELIGY